MSVELRHHPDPRDPFDGNSALSLLPRTLKDLKPTQNWKHRELEYLQSLFESVAPKGQDALKEMAETILKSSSEFQNSETQQVDVEKGSPTKLKGAVEEGRPAGGFKRARLSIIPNMSQRSVQEASSSLDQIQDPVGFLSAFKRLQNPDKELEKQRDNILMDSTQNYSETQQVTQSEDAEKDIPANIKDHGRERRPSLGLKPAKFSFKLNTSQPSSVEEMSLNIGQYQDPEEFVAAMDRMERANKEIRRLRGLTDSIEHKSSTTRKRRPGILGKRGTYKHIYPLVEANHGEVLKPTQEASEVDTLNHLSSNTETTNKHTTSQEKEVSYDGHLNPFQDSVSEPETTSNGILDELLSDSSKDFDEDEVLERLHIQRLQYEPINLEKFSLPELDILRKTDGKALESLARPRKALSDIQNVVMGIKIKRPVYTHKTSIHPHASQTPSKSPLSLVHALRRSIVQKDSCSNSFSFSGIDASPSQPASSHLDASHDDATDPMVAQANGNGSSFSGKLQSLMTQEDNTEGSGVDSGKLVTDDLAWSPEPTPAEDNRNRPSFSEKFKSLMTLQDNTAACSMDLDKLVTDDLACPPEPTQPNGNGSSFLGKFQSLITQEDNAAGSSMDLDKLVTDDLACQAVPEDDNLSKLNTQLDPRRYECDDALQNKGEEMQQEVMAIPDEQDLGHSGNGQMDNFDPAAGKSHTVDGHPKTNIIGLEQNTEGQQEPRTTLLSAITKLKEPACGGRKRNNLMRRKSLAGAGTVWEAGVRKSTRNKMRPLEYWKGERFLYGRVHKSLLTVIGCKYQSPAKDGKSTFKVKYYVSDEHKQLVDQVARH